MNNWILFSAIFILFSPFVCLGNQAALRVPSQLNSSCNASLCTKYAKLAQQQHPNLSKHDACTIAPLQFPHEIREECGLCTLCSWDYHAKTCNTMLFEKSECTLMVTLGVLATIVGIFILVMVVLASIYLIKTFVNYCRRPSSVDDLGPLDHSRLSSKFDTFINYMLFPTLLLTTGLLLGFLFARNEYEPNQEIQILVVALVLSMIYLGVVITPVAFHHSISGRVIFYLLGMSINFLWLAGAWPNLARVHERVSEILILSSIGAILVVILGVRVYHSFSDQEIRVEELAPARGITQVCRARHLPKLWNAMWLFAIASWILTMIFVLKYNWKLLSMLFEFLVDFFILMIFMIEVYEVLHKLRRTADYRLRESIKTQPTLYSERAPLIVTAMDS